MKASKANGELKQHGLFRRAVIHLKTVYSAPQMYKQKTWIESLEYKRSAGYVSDYDKKKVWQLIWHYRRQITDKELVYHAAKKTGNPMAEMTLLLEEVE